ncbi:MAG TPA: hypothetical protein DIS74_09785 [Bacteroidales bacterium]|nr:hypothetical protein [Bacteroidales bacterium]
MRKYESLVKDVTLDVFEVDIHIVVTEDPNYYVKKAGLTGWCKNDPDEDLMYYTDALTFRVRMSDYYMLLSPNTTPGTIAHECIHVIGSTFHDRNVKASYDDTEVLAYHVGWLTDIAAKAVNEYRRPNGRKKKVRRNSNRRRAGDNTESPGVGNNKEKQGDGKA